MGNAAMWTSTAPIASISWGIPQSNMFSLLVLWRIVYCKLS